MKSQIPRALRAVQELPLREAFGCELLPTVVCLLGQPKVLDLGWIYVPGYHCRSRMVHRDSKALVQTKCAIFLSQPILVCPCTLCPFSAQELWKQPSSFLPLPDYSALCPVDSASWASPCLSPPVTPAQPYCSPHHPSWRVLPQPPVTCPPPSYSVPISTVEQRQTFQMASPVEAPWLKALAFP